MTISSTTNRNDYTGDGANDTYSYSFKIFLSSELVVKVEDVAGVITALVETTDYTVTDAGETAGGTIVLVDASQAWLTSGKLTTNFKISIQRTRALLQNTDIRDQGDFFPETHEQEFDKQVMNDQQMQRQLDGAMRLPFTEVPTAAAIAWPNVTDRTSKFLAFDASGNPIASSGGISSDIPVSAFMETVLDDADGGAVMTTLGITAFMQTVLDDTTAPIARTTLDAVGLTGNETIAGNKTLSGSTTVAALIATLSANMAAGGNKLTGLAKGTANGDAVRFEDRGRIIQFQKGTSTSSFATTNSAMQNTNLSVAITLQKSDSIILIFAIGILRTAAGGGSSALASLARGSTEIGHDDGLVRCGGPAGLIDFNGMMFTSDVPGAGTFTYQVRIRSDGGDSITFGVAAEQVIIVLELQVS